MLSASKTSSTAALPLAPIQPATPKHMIRAVRSHSTMAFSYDMRRLSKLPIETQLDSEMFPLEETVPISEADAARPSPVENGEDVESPLFNASSKAVAANRRTVAMGATTPIKLALPVHQLLQLAKEDLPADASSGVKLALLGAEERIELIVDLVPDHHQDKSGANTSIFNYLVGEGAKQPAIVFGTVGYVIDYLVSPHAGGTKPSVFTKLLQAKRPSILSPSSSSNAAASSVNLAPVLQGEEDAATLARTIVRDSLALWVKHLWDSFLLTFKDGISVLDFVSELMLRFEKTTQLSPGNSSSALQQSAFETSDGHLVVASRAPGDGSANEAAMNRSARAVLMWMGIYQNHRNAVAIRTNILLLILHWIKSSSGSVDLCETRQAFDLLKSALRGKEDDATIALLKRLILRELSILQDVCLLDLERAQQCYGLDFRGRISAQMEDLDQYRMRELILCIHSYSTNEHPIPKWARSVPVFNQHPELVAGILTLLTYDLVYRHVHPLMLVSESKRQSSRPVQDMIRLFKVLSYWPLTCIFEEGLKLAECVERLLFFLAVAEQLRKLSNFHALFALVGGLTQPYMAWLWNCIPNTGAGSAKSAHKRFEDLKRVISSNGDYRVYKADLSHCQGKSRIPFLGVTARMLVQLETEINSQTSAGQHHAHLYPFSKQVARSAIINDFVGGQRHPYAAVNGGRVFCVFAGPPGPSPYDIGRDEASSTVVAGSKYAQFPPSSVFQGVFSSAGLGTGLEHPSVTAKPQVEEKRAYAGCTSVMDDLDLKLVLCWSISVTQEESALRDISKELQRAWGGEVVRLAPSQG